MLLNSVRHLPLREFGRLFDWTMSMVGEKKGVFIVVVCCGPLSIAYVHNGWGQAHLGQPASATISSPSSLPPSRTSLHTTSTATIITSGKILVTSTGDTNINRRDMRNGMKVFESNCQRKQVPNGRNTWIIELTIISGEERIHMNLPMHISGDSSMGKLGSLDLCRLYLWLPAITHRKTSGAATMALVGTSSSSWALQVGGKVWFTKGNLFAPGPRQGKYIVEI